MDRMEGLYEKAVAGSQIVFDFQAQAWFPAEDGEQLTANRTALATLLADTLFEPKIGMRTRDIKFKKTEEYDATVVAAKDEPANKT